MATEVIFVEGGTDLLNTDIVNNRFRLSPKPIAYNLSSPVFGELYSGDTYATLGEITGWTGSTAYQRITVPQPAAVARIITWNGVILWQVSEAQDGPADVRSLCLEDPTTNLAMFAWDMRLLASTITTGSHTLPVGTINVVDTALLKAVGAVRIGDQLVSYTGKTSTTLTGATGGTGTWVAGTVVKQDAIDLSGPNRAAINIPVLRMFAQNPGGT